LLRVNFSREYRQHGVACQEHLLPTSQTFLDGHLFEDINTCGTVNGGEESGKNIYKGGG